MLASQQQKIRAEVMRRLAQAPVQLPTSALKRLARTTVGLARGGTLTLKRALRKRGDREPDLDAVAAVVESVGRLKGATMKLGQMLGYLEVSLPDELRAGLAVLQTQAQPMPWEQVREILEADLGAAAKELLPHLDPVPVAAASIGQVHRAALPSGEVLAVKVRYPGITDAIARDFGPAALSTRLAGWLFPGARLDAFVADVRARVLEECDYPLEAQRQERFGELFARHPTVLVPPVHRRFSGRRVLTTTFVEGLHLEAFLTSAPSKAAVDRAGQGLFDFYLGSLFRTGLYNCDPHPGNALLRPDGSVAMLDFGCTKEFAPDLVEQLAALMQAARADDAPGIRRALVAMGVMKATGGSEEEARLLTRALLAPLLRDGLRPFELDTGLTLAELVRRARRVRGLALPGELLFLLRMYFGLAAVLRRLGARADWSRLTQTLLDAHAAAAAARASSADEDEDEEDGDEGTLSGEGAAGGTYDVVVTDRGSNVFLLLRELCEATGRSVSEMKDLVDAEQAVVARGLALADASALRQRAEAAGARVEVRPAVAVQRQARRKKGRSKR